MGPSTMMHLVHLVCSVYSSFFNFCAVVFLSPLFATIREGGIKTIDFFVVHDHQCLCARHWMEMLHGLYHLLPMSCSSQKTAFYEDAFRTEKQRLVVTKVENHASFHLAKQGLVPMWAGTSRLGSPVGFAIQMDEVCWLPMRAGTSGLGFPELEKNVGFPTLLDEVCWLPQAERSLMDEVGCLLQGPSASMPRMPYA